VPAAFVYVNRDGDSFNDPIPLAIMMKAMGTECDQEIVQLVGSDDFYQVSSLCLVDFT